MNRIIVSAAAILTVISLAACEPTSPAREQERKAAEASQQKLMQSAPIPILPISQERNNLVKRATRINVQNLSSCVILFTPSGAVVGKFAVNGKVSSLNSYLLPGDYRDRGTGGTGEAIALESPDIDGAYGKNAEGVFFFDAVTDAYIEWGGPYFWSDQCLDTTAAPILVQSSNE